MAATATANATAPAVVPYSPPHIPQNWRESFSAWRVSNRAIDSARAELHLYAQSGYLRGAQVGNAPNLPHGQAYAAATSASAAVTADLQGHKSLFSVATAGTSPHPDDGKVGVVRAVNIGPAPGAASKGSWLGGSTADSYVNMLEIGVPRAESSESIEEEKIVLLHGYGAGTAFFFQNIASLASAPVLSRNGSTSLPTRLYALDWLGMGRSSRPPYHIPQSALKAPPSSNARVHAAENFFVDSLEEWRKRMDIDRFTIVGHSLGGYLSIAYSLRYPERINRIVLVSPAGSGDNPEEAQDSRTFAPKPNGAPADAEQELRDVQADIAPKTRSEARATARTVTQDAKQKGSATEKAADSKVDSSNQPPRLSPRTRSFFKFLWEQNVSPFGILRGSGFLSPLLTGRYTSRRFGTLGDDDLRALHSYCHSIFTDRGSSEYCLAHILAPGAYARFPLTQRVAPLRVPTTFLYGSHDWMDVQGGRKCCEVLQENGNQDVATFVVPKSGHHIYLDNPTAFNELMRNILAGKTDRSRSSPASSRILQDKAGL